MHAFVAAGTANFWRRGCVATAMAAQAVLEFVVSKADVAVDTFNGMVASWAEVDGGEASAILEKNDLFATFNRGFHFVQ